MKKKIGRTLFQSALITRSKTYFWSNQEEREEENTLNL